MEKLPKRGKSKVLLKSNIIPLDEQQQLVIYQYQPKFTPKLTKQKQRYAYRVLEDKIIKEAEVGAIGYYDHFYSTLDVLGAKPFYLSTPQQEWVVNFTLSNSFKLGRKAESSRLSVQVIKSMISRTLSKNQYSEIGKSSVFINLRQKTKLEGMNIYEFQGYQYKINLIKQLLVLPSFKLVVSETILEIIIKIYSANSHLNKEQKRQMVMERVIGMNVMTNYGNGKNTLYRVQKVDFEHTVLTPKMVNQNSLKTFYKEKYQIDIKDEKQPLLVVLPRNKSSEIVLLVPELCLGLGIGHVSKSQKAQITRKMAKRPNEIYNYNQKALEIFQQGAIGRMVNLQYKECESQVLPLPSIKIGNTIVEVENSSFKIFNKKIPQSKNIRVKFYHVKNDSTFRQFANIIKSTCHGFNFDMNIVSQELSPNDLKDINYLKSFTNKQFTHLILLPRNFEHLYSEIKRYSFKHNVISQVALQTKVSNTRNLFSIAGKITIQILSKNGIQVWSPSLEIKRKDNLMIIGVTAQKSKGKKLLAIVSSVNSEVSQFRSELREVALKDSIDQQLTNIITQCANTYEKINESYPKNIIVLHSENSECQKTHQNLQNIMWEKKIEQPFDTKICYITVDHKSLVRLFKDNGKDIENPAIGTIVQNCNEEFYMISQNCPGHTVKPIKYSIRKKGNYNSEMIQELIFGECFNYFNWVGSVQVPSCLQYCRKLLNMASIVGIREHLSIQILPYL